MRRISTIVAVVAGLALSAPVAADSTVQFKNSDGKVMGTVKATRAGGKITVTIGAHKGNGFHFNADYPFKIKLGDNTLTKDNVSDWNNKDGNKADGVTLKADDCGDKCGSGDAKAGFCDDQTCYIGKAHFSVQ